jgi:hypothetical protein
MKQFVKSTDEVDKEEDEESVNLHDEEDVDEINHESLPKEEVQGSGAETD